MGGIFYLAGVGLAGYAGYSNLGWYFIFIFSLVMGVGYFIIRAPQISNAVSTDGVAAIPPLLLMQIIIYSIITTPIYFVATIFN